jgi:hypothetical protein
LLGNVEAYDTAFDFAYDWELLHHIFPQDRGRYVANVSRMLCPGARYLSVCFSENDASFGGAGKYRRTPLGTTLYFSSEQELRDLFEPLFRIEDLSTVEIAGKHGSHLVVRALLAKPSAGRSCGTPRTGSSERSAPPCRTREPRLAAARTHRRVE